MSLGKYLPVTEVFDVIGLVFFVIRLVSTSLGIKIASNLILSQQLACSVSREGNEEAAIHKTKTWHRKNRPLLCEWVLG